MNPDEQMIEFILWGLSVTGAYLFVFGVTYLVLYTYYKVKNER